MENDGNVFQLNGVRNKIQENQIRTSNYSSMSQNWPIVTDIQ